MLKTKDGRILAVEELAWTDVYNILESILPDFTRIMETVSANSTAGCKFYKASYLFGSTIINNGKCYLPLATGDSIEFGDASLPDALISDLCYDHATEDPLGLILSKNSEFYLPKNNKILSHTLIGPGYMFGIPRAVGDLAGTQPSRSALGYNLHAGARSIFMLSKITCKEKHAKLQRTYNTKVPLAIPYEDQWRVFKDIAKHDKCTWRSEVLYFPRQFIANLKKLELAAMVNYLLQKHRASYNVWHNVSLIWTTTFNDIEHAKKLTHYSDYAISTARQLFVIAANSAPAFRPAIDDETAPISFLEEAYTNGYGLADDNHSNVIMEPSNFNLSDSNAVYYSLNYPTLAQYSPETFKGKSQITLLEQVQYIADAYRSAILAESPENRVPSLYDVVTASDFSYYHYTPQDYKNVLDDALIPKQDKRFTRNKCGEFPKHSSFFKGCIKIARRTIAN